MAVKKPKIKLPDDYTEESVFLEDMRREYYLDSDYDKLNRDAGIEDLGFVTGDQWTSFDAAKRTRAHKPTLTINRLPAFAAQVVNARKMNETTIKIEPDTGGTKEVASVRQGLIRSILKNSNAEFAFETALMGNVCAGIGNFEVEVDYESDDVFDQSIKFKPILDHFSVVWDRTIVDPTGKDAKHCFQYEAMPKREFEKKYPWATPSDLMVNSATNLVHISGWFESDNVRVVNYWRMRQRKRMLAMMQDGSIQDVTDAEPEKLAYVAQHADGEPILREVWRKYAQMYVCTGADILAGPYELPIGRIPIFRVPGWELKIGEHMYRWGVIRFLKDPQRLHNYWRSTIAEKLLQTPKNKWLAADNAVSGREKLFRSSHLSDDPLLIWNSESGSKPELMPPAQLEQALIAQAEMSSQDIKDVSNIHEANLGMPSNEVSGVAIQQRQRVSDTGTAVYHANLERAIEEAGRVTDELIPVVYDTPRIVKVLGDDAKGQMVTINKLGDHDSIDLSVGKYDVTVTTGPNYETKRIESAEHMLKLANAMPQVLGVAADLIVEAQDWPGADKIAARLRKSMPTQLFSPEEMTPELRAKAAAEQQDAQLKKAAAMKEATAEWLKTQTEAALNAARAENYETEAAARGLKTQSDVADTSSQIVSRALHDHLDVIAQDPGEDANNE